MHRTSFARTQRRTTRRRACRTLRPWALENRLTRYRTTRHRTALWRTRGPHVRSRRRRWTHRGRVHRTRSRLRHDQPPWRRLRCCRTRRSCRLRNRGRWLWLMLNCWLGRSSDLFDRFRLLFLRRRHCGSRRRRYYDARSLARLRSNQARCGRRNSRGRRHFGFDLTLNGCRWFNGRCGRRSSNGRFLLDRRFHNRRRCGFRRRRCCRLRCDRRRRRGRLRRNRCCRLRRRRGGRLLL